MPRPVAYIAELLPPSAELIDKIHRKHDVTLDEVREAVILVGSHVDGTERGQGQEFAGQAHDLASEVSPLGSVDVGVGSCGHALPDHRRRQVTSSITSVVKANTTPNCTALLTVALSGT